MGRDPAQDTQPDVCQEVNPGFMGFWVLLPVKEGQLTLRPQPSP